MRNSLPFLAIFLLTACQERTEPVEMDTAASVWAVDLVMTLPGAQAAYVESIESNWAGSRKIAVDQGAVLSYRALVAPPDTTRGWDVILMTEYADSVQWSNREATFAAIFESPEFVAVEPALPSSQMRTFVASGVTMRSAVSSSQKGE